MAWSASTTAIDYGRRDGKVISFLMAAVKIYKGDFVHINAGYLTNVAPTSGSMAAGVALETVDNSGGSAGDKECLVQTEGVCRALKATAAAADIGAAALMDETTDTCTVTLGTYAPAAALLGAVVGVVYDDVTGVASTTEVWIKLKTLQQIKA